MTIPIPELFRRTLATTSAVPYWIAIAVAFAVLAVMAVAMAVARAEQVMEDDLAELRACANREENSCM